jgi:hypothetical protein
MLFLCGEKSTIKSFKIVHFELFIQVDVIFLGLGYFKLSFADYKVNKI